MTFKDEAVRLLYHSLPAATQVLYSDWETRLAKRGSRLHVYDVIAAGPISEVVVGITENFKLSAVEPDLTGDEHA
jgi:hypothetical protein